MTSSLLISAVMADQIAKSFGDGTLPEFLTKYDVNEDGSIDEEERQAIKEERYEDAGQLKDEIQRMEKSTG